MKTSIVIFLTSVVAAVQAQQTYTINPENVPLSLRQYWCDNQQIQCPLICLQTPAHSSETRQNDCDAESLTYACVCSNGLSPNLTQYSQTLPFYTCQEWGNECAANCGRNSACASACREDHPCGAQSPLGPNASAITTTMSSTTNLPAGATTDGNGGTVYNGFAGGEASATGSPGENAAVSAKERASHLFYAGLGTTAMVGGFFLGFGIML